MNRLLEKTWRWFGPDDPVTLQHLVQMGVEGVVTALHHIPNGEVWSTSEIRKRKEFIESYGLRWSVVESLPVSEGIKIHSSDFERLIENYRESVKNLGKCGLDTICYNFMPVLDWARTSLAYRMPGGGESMFFDYKVFVAFDVFLLRRPGAEHDYPEEIVREAKIYADQLSKEKADELVDMIIVVTQSFIDGAVDGSAKDPRELFLHLLENYRGMDKAVLRDNLKAFWDEVIPVAEKYGVNMAIHPDDPPYEILGIPRIIGTLDDIKWLAETQPSLRNGITFCSGSLSANESNNLQEILDFSAERIHFVHLRNTCLLPGRKFYESGHLEGSLDMSALMKGLLLEKRRRVREGRTDSRMPFRPDHGIRLLDDFDHSYHPGYPLIGRMKGLAELDGLMHGIDFMLEQKF